MRLRLSIANPANGNGAEFSWVVLIAELRGSQQEPEDLRVGRRRPACEEIEQQEHEDSAEQTAKQVESRRAQTHRKEEKPSFGTKNGEWSRQRPMDCVYAP